MESNSIKFSPLINQLNRRTQRALVSQFSFRNDTLGQFLTEELGADPGTKGSLIADPVFEATFGYRVGSESLQQMSGKRFHPDFVDALSNTGEKYKDDYQLDPQTFVPYQHQVTAWNALMGDEKKSVLVSSGTGSGKTESFLFPILNDLAEERAAQGTELEGVRALFLYPLNALIKSQRDRLAAWTGQFNGDVRFCLYNGETKKTVPERVAREERQEVKSRDALRESPPSILVTNSTMLEYMLVRKDDQPILDKSQGKLRWIVLDEAHTYVGSQAAELALMLRRVMIAFGVTNEDVRFVATSATIGSDDDDSKKELQNFLAKVAGVRTDQVVVVKGGRSVPEIKAEASERAPLYRLAAMELTPAQLESNLATRAIRDFISHGPKDLTSLHRRVGEIWPDISRTELLDFLDTLTEKEDSSGNPFLPLRGHLFEKTFGGIWACANSKCEGVQQTLASGQWGFGKVFFHPQEFCDCCNAPVFELTGCSACGSEYLYAQEERTADGDVRLTAHTHSQATDEFQLDLDDENLSGDNGVVLFGKRLLGPVYGAIANEDLCKGSGLLVELGEGDLSANVQAAKLMDDGEYGLKCNHCSESERTSRRLFLPKRLGAPFFLGDILPTVLEFCPPSKGAAGNGPFDGRRLLTFTDSRQGTARIAARLQQDTDRNYIRYIAYHAVAPVEDINQGLTAEESDRLAELQVKYEKFKDLDEDAAQLFLEKIQELASKQDGLSAENTTSLSWQDLCVQLSKDSDIKGSMRNSFKRISGEELDPLKFSDYCLYREFARRPKRGAQSELLGLVKLSYQPIENIYVEPELWRRQGGNLEQWKNFLILLVDHFLRENTIIAIPDVYQRWMGAKISFKFVMPPAETVKSGNSRIRNWPYCLRGNRRRNRIIELALVYLKLNPEQEEDCRLMDAVMADAWSALRPLMTQSSDGFQFNMAEHAMFSTVKQAWKCPYTRTIVPVTLDGMSPYTTVKASVVQDVIRAQKITMPSLPARYWHQELKELPSPKEWLETNADVVELRKQWLWPNRSDRAAAKDRWFSVGEHSAQQATSRLDQLEKDFKEGRVNVLSCSTTMEMGVDIGGMSAVVMNNVPPSQANYLQRAGRAGRRKENSSLAVTLCKQNSHGLEVFNNPLWPFDQSAMSVPKVPFDSRPIVQRHVNALLLSEWLKTCAHDIPKLNCEWLFEQQMGDLRRVQQFENWCFVISANREADPFRSLINLIKGTILSGFSVEEILKTTTDAIAEISTTYTHDIEVLADQRAQYIESNRGNENLPAVKAIDRQLYRARNEYLLKELTTVGFLPGHGFPSGIVTLLTSTMKDFKRPSGNEDNSRIDVLSVNRGEPTRSRSVAIREFAPGSDIVMDGAVYQSSGLTLNWKIPANAEAPPENLPLKWSWFCNQCGAGGTSHLMPARCSVCEAEKLKLNQMVEPNGFAVALSYKPHNDVNTPQYLPYNPPRVNISEGERMHFINKDLGVYRYSDYGSVLSYNSGPHGVGYALCLHCGLAEAQKETDQTPAKFIDPPHYRLRGGRETKLEEHCPGNDHDWAIKHNLWLAGEDVTSVLELRLKDGLDGADLTDPQVAWSVAYALRHGLVSILGIESNEVCVAVQQVAEPGCNEPVQAIYLYDSASSGAGYVSQLPGRLDDIIGSSLSLLNCNDQCDSACNACLLDWDSQHHVDMLDRNKAGSFLSKWSEKLIVPEDYRELSECISVVHGSLSQSIREKQAEVACDEICLFAAPEVDDWDLSNWHVLEHLLNDQSVVIKLVALEGTFRQLPDSQQRLLVAMCTVTKGRLQLCETKIGNTVGNGVSMLASINGAQPYFWLNKKPNLVPGPSWGDGDDALVVGHQSFNIPMNMASISDIENIASQFLSAAVPLTLKTQCNGDISGFGGRFWAFINDEAGENIFQKGELKEIYYRDRYLVTPLHAALLQQIMSSLSDQVSTDTQISIETAHFYKNTAQPSLLTDNWADSDLRGEVIRDVLETTLSQRVTLNVKPKRDMAHSRELKLIFVDGSVVKVILDEGVGCWRSNGRKVFDFSQRYSVQSSQLLRLSATVTIAQPDIGTAIFVLKE